MIAAGTAFAETNATTDDGERVVLHDDGTWTILEESSDQETTYTKMEFVDLLLDIRSLAGEKIETSAVGQLVGNMFLLKQSVFDLNVLFVDIDGLPREQRKMLLTSCSAGCRLTVSGSVGTVMLQPGIIAEKISL